MKNKKTYSKHDLRRNIEDVTKSVYFIAERLRRIETVFNDFIEMQKLDDKFTEYLDGKYKQPERKSSGRDPKTSK
jgi:hypothetical protein|tara:strand:- start:1747 stop:1971 length:225 start_codon:yes stop_codon:yes gene_type:complete